MKTTAQTIAKLTAKLEAIQARIAAGDCRNEMHDAEADTRRAIRDAEDARDTRRWTGADRLTWNLICNNVD